MASSSSSLKKFHVFISFRGEDTRRNFTSILYSALRDKSIETYIDDSKLEKGDEISPALLKGIEESMISVIIFSENYADSRWCLDELNHILLCKKTKKQLVVPVFYNVDPSNIRHQKGSYAVAFVNHEKRFSGETRKLEKWRESLATAANLAGWNSSDYRSDSELVKEIVKDIVKKLEDCMLSSDDFNDLFGIEENIKKIESLLSICPTDHDIRIVGIWGMGGIGKTTLARVLFDRLSSQFDGSSFLEKVKEEYKKHPPLDLQKKVFSELLKDKELQWVSAFVKDRLRRKKVLLVLDDVDNVRQLDHLAKDRNWFGSGSRIIVTSRDSQVLRNFTVDKLIYEVKELSFSDALQLFHSKAFQGDPPTDNSISLSNKVVVRFAKGNPLALKVLGCHLYSRGIDEWQSELEKLIPNQEVQEILKVSYDGLSNNTKDIFLDIACLLAGRDRRSVKRILGYNYLGVIMEMRVLVDKCLITMNHDEIIQVHELIREMGEEIVRQQSTNDPGERSRLWSTKEICKVLKHNRGTKKIQGMSLNMSEIEDAFSLESLVFKDMHNLWFLDFVTMGECKLHFPEELHFLPNTLRYFYWNCCPLKSFPPSFRPENLGELVIYGSNKIEQLWNADMDLKNLKVLNLNGCNSLTQIPNLTHASNLEDLDISFCSRIDKFPVLPDSSSIKSLRMTSTQIEDVPPSIKCLLHVTILMLDCCYSLKSLPATFCELKSLRILSLEASSKFEHFPEILEPMECLEELLLDITAISVLPRSLQNLIGLKTLSLQHCEKLEVIPDTIYHMRIEYLNIYGCRKLKSLPMLPFSTKHLNAIKCESLHMVSNPWIVLAQGLRDVVAEQEFHFSDCPKLDHNNIMTEFQIRVLAGTLISLSEHRVSKSCRVPEVVICSPVNDIPKWFFSQSEGSSITIKLDLDWCSSSFVGFAVCTLISFKTNSSLMGVDLLCNVRFLTESGESCVETQRCFKMKTSKGIDHIVMQSFGVDCIDVSGAVKASFDFHHKGRYVYGSNDLNVEVKKCGIRILYLRDAEELRLANSQYLRGESSVIINVLDQSDRGTTDVGPANSQNQHGRYVVTNEAAPSEHNSAEIDGEDSAFERVQCCLIL